MITINTKKAPNGTWFCFATIQGYDHSFDGKNEEIARNKMWKFLVKRNVVNGYWLPTVIYPPKQKQVSHIGWKHLKLDNL